MAEKWSLKILAYIGTWTLPQGVYWFLSSKHFLWEGAMVY